MKKTILATSIISIVSLCSYAVQYNALISKEHSKFKSTEKYEIIEYTEWLNTGILKDCINFTPLDSTIYIGNAFSQTQDCLQTQERSSLTYTVSSLDDSRVLKETKIEFQDLSEQRTIISTGTKKPNSCSDILNNNASLGDGLYTISLSGVDETVLCDMTNDDGGWTLLMSSGDDIERVQMTSLNINKDNPPTIADYSNYNYFPKMDDFISRFNSNTNIRFSCRDENINQTNNYFHKNINNFDTYFNIGSGNYTGTITCSNDENFSDGLSTIPQCIGANGAGYDGRYYKAAGTSYGWAHYSGGGLPQMLRHCGTAWYGTNSPSHNGYIWFK